MSGVYCVENTDSERRGVGVGREREMGVERKKARGLRENKSTEYLLIS